MTNPLIAKYEEIYGKKEEPKPDYYKGEKSYAEELEELEKPKPEYVKPSQEQTDTLNKYLENLNFPRVPPQSVATSNTGITAANPYPKVGSYDTYVAFLDIGEKIKRGDAQVVSVSVNMEHFRKSYTFEVQVYN